jgi:hypothetical protein
MRGLAAAVATVIVLYGSPAFALTPNKQTVAPPGNSAVGDYVEDVPTAGGGRPVPSVQSLSAQRSALTAAVAHRLAAAGPNGHRTASLAEGTAPPSSASRQTAATYGRLLEKDAGGVIGSLTRSVTGGDGGLGVLLPILLAACVVVGAGVAVSRRRRGRS